MKGDRERREKLRKRGEKFPKDSTIRRKKKERKKGKGTQPASETDVKRTAIIVCIVSVEYIYEFYSGELAWPAVSTSRRVDWLAGWLSLMGRNEDNIS